MAVTPSETDVVERQVRIEASPETVFPFFTDPGKMVRWMGTEATLDPRPGGIYRVNVTGRGTVRGEFVEIVPYTRVVFTWGWEDEAFPVPPSSTVVDIALIPDGGGTIVKLRHSGLPETMQRFHRFGWEHYLGRLAVAGSGGHPGTDPLTSLFRAPLMAARHLPWRHAPRAMLNWLRPKW